MITPQEVLEALRRVEEPKGYFMHADVGHCEHVALSLLENEKRYGYRSCPCRLASGNRQDDADLICPCEYREADVEESGACYCHLFVSAQYRQQMDFYPEMDDRRPPEKVK